MKGLLLKEWYTQGRVLLVTLIALAAVVRLDLGLFDSAMAVLPLPIALLPLFSLNRDAVSHFDRWYPVLPMKRSTYADFYYILTAVLTGLFLLVNALLYLHADSTVDCRQLAGLLAGVGTLCLLMPAVYLPVTCRFGITAGRIAALLLLPVYVLFPFFGFGVIDWFNWLSIDIHSVGIMVLGLCMLSGFILSRMLSVRALREAES